MNLLCALDDAYEQHCAVMLTSLFRNTPGEGFKVYALHQGLSEQAKGRLHRLCKKHHHEFIPLQAEHSALSDVPMVLEHAKLATYFRLLVTHLLPEDLDRVLYLDSDLIIRSDLRPFYEQDLGDHIVAAVAEAPTAGQNERLRMDPEVQYFNAGVIVMNLAVWRREQIGEQALRFAVENEQLIEWADQDALNATSNGRALICSPKWNAGQWLFREDVSEIPGASPEELRVGRENPAIAHFTGSSKPWNGGMSHGFAHEYFLYLKQTPYFGRLHMARRIRSKGRQMMRKLAFK